MQTFSFVSVENVTDFLSENTPKAVKRVSSFRIYLNVVWFYCFKTNPINALCLGKDWMDYAIAKVMNANVIMIVKTRTSVALMAVKRNVLKFQVKNTVNHTLSVLLSLLKTISKASF